MAWQAALPSTRLTLRFGRAAKAFREAIRTVLRGLRCNGLSDCILDNLLTCQFRHIGIFIMLDKHAEYLHH